MPGCLKECSASSPHLHFLEDLVTSALLHPIYVYETKPFVCFLYISKCACIIVTVFIFLVFQRVFWSLYTVDWGEAPMGLSSGFEHVPIYVVYPSRCCTLSSSLLQGGVLRSAAVLVECGPASLAGVGLARPAPAPPCLRQLGEGVLGSRNLPSWS